jgi:iron complex transport system substrate-binding protein
MMRIASLLASGTELVCALGAGEQLVARSHECDHPSWVARLPCVSRPTFDITGTSGEIDALVRARLAAGEPLYEVDEARLAELRPDIVITQTHCEVCAVSPGDLAHAGPGGSVPAGGLTRQPVVALRGGTVAEILEGFASVAGVLGLDAAGHALVDGIRARLAALAATTRPLRHPTLVCIEWIDPVFTMSNWGPELVEAAGGRCLLGWPGEHSSVTAWQAVRDADPEVLVIAPCGFALPRALAEMPALAAQPGWSELAAVRAGRVFVADGNLYFNRSGPSLFETPEILAEMLHPDRFPPRHRGAAWVPWAG